MIKVMIIEDDPMVRDINGKFLNKIEGFELSSSVGSLKEAHEYLKQDKPDLILLDIYIPRENGLDFLKFLRKNEIYCDVILITADKSKNSVKEAFMYGAVDYLIKPFTFERFEEAIKTYKERFIKLKSYESIEQNIIDEMINNMSHEEEEKEGLTSTEDLDKGLNKFTYFKIWDFLISLKEEYFTAEEVAERLGMARITVRRYLEHMSKEGKLVIKLEYGRVGRPKHMYKINL
ncbi:response regulator [Clostridium malenominatum]|uniref:Transcriptional regulatory protein n=1 Tax=Clostridium malenominatum TaxID=1539 RepID=A0ABN1IY45_9CLOT